MDRQKRNEATLNLKDLNLEQTKKDDTKKEHMKIEKKKKEDATKGDTKPPSPTESEHIEEQPLEIGGYLTPLSKDHPAPPPSIQTLARDLIAGQTFLYQGRPVEIISRTHTLAQTGTLASRHKVHLEVVDLFDKERVGGGPLVFRAKDPVERVQGVERARWCFVCYFVSPSFPHPRHTPCLHSLNLQQF